MPVVWDTANGAARTIVVRARVDNGYTLNCYYYSWKPDGTSAGTGTFTAMPINVGWTFAQLTGVVVPPGAQAKVMCALPPNSHGKVLGIDYVVP